MTQSEYKGVALPPSFGWSDEQDRSRPREKVRLLGTGSSTSPLGVPSRIGAISGARRGPPRQRPVDFAVPAALFLAVFACGGDDEPLPPDVVSPSLDAGPNDAEPLDLGPPDLGVPDLGPLDGGPRPDVGRPFAAASCAPCGGGGTCPGGGACLTNRQTNESFCADRCDDDLDGCIAGFNCLDLAPEGVPPQHYCVPPGSTCQDGVGFGTPCYDGPSACRAGLDHCEADFFALGYCTRSCSADEDCPAGYRCGPGDQDGQVCLSEKITPAERCAVAPGRAACETHYDCAFAEGDRCVRGTPRLPGICASECRDGCGEGFTCARTDHGPRCLPDDCRCHASGLPLDAPPGTRDLLAEVLTEANLDRCQAGHLLADLAPNPPDLLYDPYRLSFFEAAAHEPLRAPELGRAVVGTLDAAAARAEPLPRRAAEMVEILARRLDRPVTRVDPEPLDATAPLVRALEALIRAAGGTPDPSAIAADAQDLSAELSGALARVIEGMTRAARARSQAIPADVVESIFELGPSFVVFPRSGRGLDPTSPVVRNLLNRDIDYGVLFGGAADLLEALAEADLARFRGTSTRTSTAPAVPLFSQPTPLGQIVVGGPEPDVYEPSLPGLGGDIALLLDLGGNDIYRVAAGGNRSAAGSVSVLVDLGGADIYGYVEVQSAADTGRLPSDEDGRREAFVGDDSGPFSYSNRARQGGGRAGTAVTWDLGDGADIYRSLRMSQGCGIFGAGVLLDEGGDDVFEMEAMGQGAGAFGIGLLVDAGGDDVRRAYYEAQGFGYARGAGLAYDVAGGDAWLMNVGDPEIGGDPLYFSPQRPGRANTSLGQGFGFGRRADFTDRAFFSGGLGILVDAEGADRYEASVFAQGGGFWFGTGILADHAGDDDYDALWYAMGTGAHYALGLFFEGGGNDAYGGAFPRVNVTIAGAHDYTTAFLIDDAGDDLYFGSRISIGAGNVNGLGFFVDNAGDDQYDLRSAYGLGGAGNLEQDDPGLSRRKVKNLGVFIDAGGRDTYTVGGMPLMDQADNRSWRSAPQNTDPGVAASEVGVGIDGEGSSTIFARPRP